MVGAARISSTLIAPSPYTSSSWITSSARPRLSRPMSKSEVSGSGTWLASPPEMAAVAVHTFLIAVFVVIFWCRGSKEGEILVGSATVAVRHTSRLGKVCAKNERA